MTTPQPLMAAPSESFAALARIEPGLARLMRDVRAVRDTGAAWFCANDCWYQPGGFKSRLLRLAGWFARKPELRNSESYDIAYDAIYAALPDCRACACIALEREVLSTYACWRRERKNGC